MTKNQRLALAIIKERGAVSNVVLASHMGVTPVSAARSARKLAELGKIHIKEQRIVPHLVYVFGEENK